MLPRAKTKDNMPAHKKDAFQQGPLFRETSIPHSANRWDVCLDGGAEAHWLLDQNGGMDPHSGPIEPSIINNCGFHFLFHSFIPC